MNEIEKLRNYFIEKAKTLSIPFDEQIKIDSDGFIGENLPEDIAEEWVDSDLDSLVQICSSKEKADTCVKLYKEIEYNFDTYTLNKENVWNLEALKNHPFWDNQRKLASRLLKELIEK